MNFTNKLNFPQYIADWLQHDDYDHNYDPHTISATSLMKPLRATIITERHFESLERDVQDLIPSSIGTAIHDSIEKVQTENVIKEVRVERNITIPGRTYKVTGKFDILVKEDDGTYTLRDIKTTSVWAYIYGGKDADYITQLSIYRWLLSETYPMNPVGYIDFFFTDWQSGKAKMEDNYPKHRIAPGYALQLKEPAEIEEYIKQRLMSLESQRLKEDDDLNFCTWDELWATPEVFAVYKNGGKRATKLCDSRAQAETYMSEKKIDGFIQRRNRTVKRCGYCAAFPFCNQGQDYAEKGLLA